MTVLAGLWRFSEQSDTEDLQRYTSDMIDAQYWMTAKKCIHTTGQTVFGQANIPAGFKSLSAVYVADGILLAIDARVDNREELFDKLSRPRDHFLDDESLLFLSYLKWGDELVDQVLGDFAIVAWNRNEQAITLIRDTAGQRPLHYFIDDSFVAIASMPRGLLALENVHAKLDTERLAGFVSDIPQHGSGSFYCGIHSVKPGQIVRITRDGAKARTYWHMPTAQLRYRNDDDYIDAFREQLDRATQVRLRGGGAIVAAQLSAGLDSGAVAATAARLLASTGGRVLAMTSAPRAGFSGPVPHGRIGDESSIAAELVALYPNMDHKILRSSGTSPLDSLDEDSRIFDQPVGLPCNNVWWRAVNVAARAQGATVMLTGEMGNLTISAGGLGVLADFIRDGQYIRWLREITALERGEPRWRGLLAASFAPWLSKSIWAKLHRLSNNGRVARPATFLSDAASDSIASSTRSVGDPNRHQRERESRWDLVRLSDPGNFRKGALLRWGIDERDPTADRRLVEFCFSLPPEQLLGTGKTRRIARNALADRLPATILDGPRGYQFADWYEALNRQSLTEYAARIAIAPGAAAVINFDELDRQIAEWPRGDWASTRTIQTYRIGILRALSAGAFALNATS